MALPKLKFVDKNLSLQEVFTNVYDASLQVIPEFFFVFPKKWVGWAMGNEALNWGDLNKKVIIN